MGLLLEVYNNVKDERFGRLRFIVSIPMIVFISFLIHSFSFDCPNCGVELFGFESGRCPECDYGLSHEDRVEKRLERIENALSDEPEVEA